MKRLSLLAAAGASLVCTSAMQAVTISLNVTENGVGGSLTASSSTGVVNIVNTSFDDFTLNTVTGLGTPFYDTPELNLQTLDVTSKSTTGSHTLNIWVTETGLTSPKNLPVNLAFAGILTGVSSETVTAYYDPSDAAYGKADTLATWTNTSPGGSGKNFSGLISGVSGGPFSESEWIVATFNGGMDTLNASAHITSAVPEPVSLGLMGAGLLGLGVLGYRRRKS